MPKKNYVFDTNVLIYDPTSIFRFQDNNVWIPIYVLEEIDGLKSDIGERGKAAREVARHLDELRSSGLLSDGITINDGAGSLFIYTPAKTPKLSIATEDKKDHLILATAIEIKNSSTDIKTILVTMDINLRVRAEALGMQVAPYEYQSVDISNLGNDIQQLDLDNNDFSDLHSNQSLFLKEDLFDIYDFNTPVMVTNGGNIKQTALAIVKAVGTKKALVKFDINSPTMGIKPKNMEQKFALQLLKDPDIKMVTLMGTSGVGKTLLALAVGLEGILNGTYNKLLISRSVMPMGRDLGFLPGDIDEKLSPYMQPFFDNLDFLSMAGKLKSVHKKTIEELFNEGLIQVEPITYIRGRSIPNQFIIVDEFQNLSQHEAKTIISRCGDNTKIVLTGDPDQIDNPYLDKRNNGLSICVKKVRNSPIVAHLKLEKGQRSELANIAVEKL